MTKTGIERLKVLTVKKPKVAVYFSSYKNPSYLYIEIFNPSSEEIACDVEIYVDTYDTSFVPDVSLPLDIPAESKSVIEEPTSELDLGKGKHFVFVSVTTI